MSKAKAAAISVSMAPKNIAFTVDATTKQTQIIFWTGNHDPHKTSAGAKMLITPVES